MSEMVHYTTEAKRSNTGGRPNYAGFLSSWTIKFFGRYMTRHMTCADGTEREAHNWKYGMPISRYVESLSRHYVELSELWDRIKLYKESTPENIEAFEEAMGGVLFNINGLIHEYERAKEVGLLEAMTVEGPPSSDAPPRVLRKSESQSTQSSGQ